jgi:hypothetical protein
VVTREINRGLIRSVKATGIRFTVLVSNLSGIGSVAWRFEVSGLEQLADEVFARIFLRRSARALFLHTG